ncbi:MAG: glycine/sarcosine/betaine reductase component B subunit [Chloroflexi bacterium]|nr:glycine/sarcosine/betaine reductase component B subunit [Chloroflexota bacterium]
MRLELAITRIRDVKLATETHIREGTLFVDLEELRATLLKDSRLGSVDVDVARPGEDCRIAHVFDLVELRARSGGEVFRGPSLLFRPSAAAGHTFYAGSPWWK